MVNREDLFELCLQELEAGVPLEALLARLPDEAADLKELLSLAAAMRALPQPAPAPEKAARRWQHVLKVFANGRGPGPQPNRRPGLAWAGRALAGLAVVALIVWAVSLASPPGAALAARITEAAGRVEVAAGPGEDWRLVAAGDSLLAGQSLRTGDGSAATLRFADGSLTRLYANSSLTLTAVDRRPNQAVSVHLTQHAGRTAHEVQPRGPEAAFVVATPAGAARVQGTAFNVFVGAAGLARFAVEAGQVRVEAAGEAVVLSAGQATLTLPGRPPGLPADEFREQGPLVAVQNTVWMVGGVPVRVSDETVVNGRADVGAIVDIVGRVLANGVWLADVVEVVSAGAETASFTGVLVDMGLDSWRVGGATVAVSDRTVYDPALEPGAAVRVTFELLPDGRWQATRIEALEREPPPIAPPAASPSLAFEPDELLVAGCGPEFSVSGRLVNDGEPPRDNVSGVQLDYRVIRGAVFMETVRIEPDNWGLILAGESVSFKLNFSLNPQWSQAADGAEVKIQVQVGEVVEPAGESPARLTVTVVRQCRPAPTATATPAEGAAPTATSAPTQTKPAAGPADNPICLGGTSHPIASALAEHFGVPYAEIARWFCSGFGFGEIRLAYEISAQTGQSGAPVPVAEIFALRQTGLGWGDLMIQFGILPGVIPPPAQPPDGAPPASAPGASPTPQPPEEDEPDGTPPFGPPVDVPTAGSPPGIPPGGGPPGGPPPPGGDD